MTASVPDFRLNRVLSKPLTSFLLHLPLTPNHVTLLSLGFGISAGLLFSRGAYLSSLLGAACYELACVLDNCDGEIARAKNLGSVFGGWFDLCADFLTDLSLFAGIGWAVVKSGAYPRLAPVALALCLLGAVMHFLLVIAEKNRGFGPASFNNPHPDVKYRERFVFVVFDALREGDASWLVLAFAVAGQTFSLLWFAAVYMQVLWVSAAFLNLKYLLGAKK